MSLCLSQIRKCLEIAINFFECFIHASGKIISEYVCGQAERWLIALKDVDVIYAIRDHGIAKFEYLGVGHFACRLVRFIDLLDLVRYHSIVHGRNRCDAPIINPKLSFLFVNLINFMGCFIESVGSDKPCLIHVQRIITYSQDQEH